MSTPSNVSPPIAVERSAVLDDAHLGDIRGALGTIAHHDTAPRGTWRARLRTLLAIIGPGLIVMVGDNDAGAFGTYTQAGQNYGTTLLWTLLLLVPVLYVNQEMVLRLGAVTGVGHARLIFERFGRFWGAFSVIDLFLLNALTIVTEFIGITFVLAFFGLPKVAGVCVAAALTMAAVSTGDFRRFERFAVVLCVLSLLLVPVLVSIHPPVAQMTRDFLVPNWPAHAKLSDVMLLVIGIVGTTVAPWQLFFQQSYVIDKRITPRFMKYEKVDLWIGIAFVLIGSVAMIGFSAALFGGHPEAGNFTDAGGIIAGLEKYAGRTSATLFAVALLDACIIGAAAVSLSTAYAIGDVFKIRHSLHRGVGDAKGFYLVYFGIVAAAATLVLIPGSPLGLLTEAVQTLAGVLLPSATVFLLVLCNDRQVLGPWVNSMKLNVFTGAVVWVLVLLSIVLTASVMYPDISGEAILDVLVGGTVLAIAGYLATVLIRRNGRVIEPGIDRALRDTWRMPPLDTLAPQKMTLSTRIWMAVLRGYLVIAVGLVIVKVVQMMLLK
ncbi:NRAMP family divalent metal transporter [Burkholderia pseudomultivorans]|uniref:Divalent metal cation transporter MntH n=1 Tax=Burkholderia pseudomultivorans TaxID=1207504 RepID=A0ABU2DY23_9BURK|nr:NRAMP family divalent metal transporter [Burkholderia pseudomultivorans]MDR8726245.1 Divalent metal cation transporter MntH [Burkholderia pseudomultivorans]MDR8732929.1 Divalent metal cation transporter MntH [Burkholderia pseudomultivorans]MDR8739795.1 Divalent metal cation transporter MntH [Burkholderia pseudomultivorans]MDR8752487.1 Divalent metal cation transporter MntH [Burkholderia pseudomultivorans]MDR8775901.1 Divalent metal cation transporter MntH [Burkholderia pseudomultivorans]